MLNTGNSTLKGKIMNDLCYISVDIETTGPVPGLYSMYELGACVVGCEEERFENEVKLLAPDSYDKATLTAMHIADISVLLKRKGTSSATTAMNAFAKWVKHVAGDKKPVFVANNAPFDWMFIAWYFKKFGVKNPFGHAALDMKAYFMGKTHCSWNDATLKKMAAHAGVPFATLPHRAVLDAVIQSQIFSSLLKS